MLKKIQKYKFLVLIILTAIVLRLFRLNEVPPALNWDEVSHGYNAYSILKTGKDEWGVSFPTIFRCFGDYKLPVYIYLTVLSVGILGLNPWSIRLVSVLAGVTTVILSYLLTYELIGKRKISKTINLKDAKAISLFASFLVAVEPWSFFLSRGAFEANLATTLIVIGVHLFLKGFENKKLYFWSTLSFGLSVWTYNSARVFVPILIAFLVLLYKKPLKKIFDKKRKILLTSVVVLLVFCVPMFWQLARSNGQARYEKVSILDQGAILEINNARNSSNLSPFLARAIHNKATFFVSRFLLNWTSHLSGDFLFFKGGNNYQFSIPGRGILYLINLPFLLIGIFALLKSTKKGLRSAAVILFWFFVGSFASGLTRETPHVLRSITTLPTPMIITSLGLWEAKKFLDNSKQVFVKIIFNPIYFLFLGLCIVGYMNNYFNDYPKKYSQSWQYGNKEMAELIRDKYDDYDKIVITKKYGEPHVFILFYWPWDPKAYQNDSNLIRFEQSDWYWVDGFDKFYFVNDWQIDEQGTGNYMFSLENGGVVDCLPGVSKCLLVTSPDNAPVEWTMLDKINFLDGSTAYEIYKQSL